jgi:hypothetical protein
VACEGQETTVAGSSDAAQRGQVLDAAGLSAPHRGQNINSFMKFGCSMVSKRT